MSVADWIILAFLLFSVVSAAWEGFFHEAFGLAGLILGYLLAAWQYRRLADWFEPILKQPWLGEIGAFATLGVFGEIRHFLATVWQRPCALWAA